MHSEDILNRGDSKTLLTKISFRLITLFVMYLRFFFRHRDRFKIKRSTALVNVLFLCHIMNGVGLKRFNFVLQ